MSFTRATHAAGDSEDLRVEAVAAVDGMEAEAAELNFAQALAFNFP